MVGVLVVGFIANLLIRPVDQRHHVSTEESTDESTEQQATEEPQPTYAEEAR